MSRDAYVPQARLMVKPCSWPMTPVAAWSVDPRILRWRSIVPSITLLQLHMLAACSLQSASPDHRPACLVVVEAVEV